MNTGSGDARGSGGGWSDDNVTGGEEEWSDASATGLVYCNNERVGS